MPFNRISPEKQIHINHKITDKHVTEISNGFYILLDFKTGKSGQYICILHLGEKDASYA